MRIAFGNPVPRSQIITVPPPYSPFGMVPSNVLYSIGWSSTCTASRFSPGHQARAARHRPALHHAVELEPEIVMQARRRVLLDDEVVALARAPAVPRGSGVTSNFRFLR